LKNLFSESGSMSNSQDIFSTSKVAAIIPARFASTRFPGKPLVSLCGKPMIQWVIEGVKTSQYVTDIYIATDHLEIAKVAESCGVRSLMTSPDCQTGSDRVYQAVQILKNENKNYEYVLNVQGDEPLISKNYIDPLAQALLADADLDMATLSHPLSEYEVDNLNAVKVLTNQNSVAIYFSRFAIPFSRERFVQGKFDSCVQKHIGLYGFKTDFLEKFCTTPQSQIEKAESLEQLRALHLGAQIKVISVPEPIQGIDTPEDLKTFEMKYKLNT
jgi:3-deoxy-manno-octulosonate cytidylyltransferase (CMP-KDO synthetase)